MPSDSYFGQVTIRRLVEHVVGHLPGGVTELGPDVEEDNFEPAQAGLVGGNYIDSATGILLTVEREIVLEHLHTEFAGRVRAGL